MKSAVLAILLLCSIPIFGQSFSFLKIELNTSGAIVYLDKVQIKNEILANVLTVASGEHEVTAVKDGYLPFRTIFSLIKSENKTINITLERDTQSTINFSSSITGIRGKIDYGIDFNVPSIQRLPGGIYLFSFSKPGLINAQKSVPIMQESKYEVYINLSPQLPEVNPSEIGRSFKPYLPATDFSKPETKLVPDKKASIAPGLIGAVILGTLLTIGAEKNKALAPFVGGGLGYVIGAGIGYKQKQVPDEENIRYNREEVPKILKEKNAEIDATNDEIKKLVEVKQKQKYNESAISVIKK